jgi:hypothetical protein
MLGDALFLLPEDVNAILRHDKQKPPSTAAEPQVRKSEEPRKVILPDQSVSAQVYTPPMLG